jgi:hypothetical protein
MTQDPFDLLRDQLVAAAAPAPVRAARRRRARPLVVLAAALALGGTATATAVLTLGGEPSPPLKGRVPGARGADGARAYAVLLRPDLRAGVAGWCSTVALRDGRRPIGAGSGCGPALEAASPSPAGGGMVVSPTRVLVFRIVDRRVAAVRLADGRRIVPRADPDLPFGWRAAIAFVPVARGKIDERALAVDLLGPDGRALAHRDPRGVPDLPTAKVDPHDPPARPCAIGHRALPHLAALDQTIVKSTLTRAIDASGHPLRTCGTALFRLDGVRLRAAVLVDARGPAHVPAALPGGYVPAQAVARRVAGGHAWLVVDGGTAPARGRLLEALTVHPPRR